MSQTVSGLDLQSLALGLDLKLKICECDMSLQTVESEGSKPWTPINLFDGLEQGSSRKVRGQVLHVPVRILRGSWRCQERGCTPMHRWGVHRQVVQLLHVGLVPQWAADFPRKSNLQIENWTKKLRKKKKIWFCRIPWYRYPRICQILMGCSRFFLRI